MFTRICKIIKSNIILLKRVIRFTYIHVIYVLYPESMGSDDLHNKASRSNHKRWQELLPLFIMVQKLNNNLDSGKGYAIFVIIIA